MSAIQDLRVTVARLRGPGGCPWDREQDHQSLANCLMEECCELLDTIDREDMEHMREELGDVLLQVIFHAHLAEESGHFDFDSVAAEINEKLIRRHPHVFGDASLDTSEKVLKRWEQIKAEERNGTARETAPSTLFKDLPPQLPALLFARDVYKQIERKQLPLPESVDPGRIAARAEDLDEIGAGALLFEAAAACHRAGVDPESALRRFTSAAIRELEGSSTQRS